MQWSFISNYFLLRVVRDYVELIIDTSIYVLRINLIE